MRRISQRKKVALIAIIMVIQLTQFHTVTGIDFGFSKIINTVSTGTTTVAKASVGAVASIPGLVNPSETVEVEKSATEIEEMVDAPTAPDPSTPYPDSLETAQMMEGPTTSLSVPDAISEPENEDKDNKTKTTSSSGSWIPSVIKRPVDTLTGIPGTVYSGAGEAWSTVSETIVNSDPAHSVKFYLYDNPENLTEFKQLVVGQEDTLRSVDIPKDSRVNILIHGFMQDINSSMLQDMKDTFLLHTGEPVICVDWGHMADGKWGPDVARTLMYPFVVDNVATVGVYVGEFIVFLKNNTVISSFDQVHVLGFSLGAHVSGIAGWTVQYEADGEKLGRITGLDPAGPKFFLKTKERRLNKDDAKFVDVIHTSHLGYFLQMGHVDFFPNGGKIQPGCVETETGITDTVTSLGSLLTGSCSHAKAWQFYTRSIKDNEMYGCECNNIFKYELTGCEVECEDKVPFGELTPSSARGNYFLSI